MSMRGSCNECDAYCGGFVRYDGVACSDDSLCNFCQHPRGRHQLVEQQQQQNGKLGCCFCILVFECCFECLTISSSGPELPPIDLNRLSYKSGARNVGLFHDRVVVDNILESLPQNLATFQKDASILRCLCYGPPG